MAKHPHLTKRGNIWHCYITLNGKRVQRSTGRTDIKAAEAVLRRLEREASDPVHAAAAQTTLADAIRGLLEEREAQAEAGRRADGTLNFYRTKTGQLARVLDAEHLPLSQLTAAVVDGYIRKRRQEEASENTISKELIALRAALKLAIRAGVWDGRIEAVIPVGFAPEYKPGERALTVDEVAALLSALQPDRAARVAFAVATSANLGETDRARREDVAADCATVHIRGTKRATRLRTVPVTLPVQQWLLALAATHGEGEDGLLFRPWDNIGRDLPAACKRAGIEHTTSNDLRRTCATWLVAAGASPFLASKVLGHKSDRMVQAIYAKLSLEDLRKSLATSTGSPCITGASTLEGPRESRETHERNDPRKAGRSTA